MPNNSSEKTIAQVVVGLPVGGPFDYFIGEDCRGKVALGQRVHVPFGGRVLVGYVVGLVSSSRFKKLKPIYTLLDLQPAISPMMLELCQKLSDYYGCTLGEAIEITLPALLRKKRSLPYYELKSPPPLGISRPSALVMGDGRGVAKEAVLNELEQVFQRGQNAIVLVPDSSRIAVFKKDLQERLKMPVAELGGHLTDKAELEQWLSIRKGEVRLVIGTRSAVFAPLPNLGLLVMMDEDHRSYKEDRTPFYHARQVALFRAEIEKFSLVLCSPAPSTETWYLAQKKKFDLKSFADKNSAEWKMIDLKNYKTIGRASISLPLQQIIQNTVEQGDKILLFLNRRGFSMSTRCQECGQPLRCLRCEVALSYLSSRKQLVCHLCGWATEMPKKCPECKGAYLKSAGGGIEKVASEVARIYPHKTVFRIDRDTKRIPPNVDILIATQAVIKVLADVQPDVIAVLDFDAEISRIDFRSEQRVFSLLMRLRSAAKKTMLVQARETENIALMAAKQQDYKGFYRKDLQLRKDSGLPPFRHVLQIMLRGKKETEAAEQVERLFAQLNQHPQKGVDMLAPQRDLTPKLRDQFRFIIMLRGTNLIKMQQTVSSALKAAKIKKSTIVTVHVDP